MSDFQSEIDESLGYSIQWAGQGPAGSGKTHFLLTAPEPVCVFLFSDFGGVEKLKRNVPEFKQKDIRWIDFDFNPADFGEDERSEKAMEEYNRFLEKYAVALRNFRTVGFDKEDLLWELLRYARLGAMTDKPNKYYELNNEYRALFHKAAKAGVNLGVIRGMKEKWGMNKQGNLSGLGINEPRGQKFVSEIVDVVLQHRWDNDEREFKTMIAPPSGVNKDDEGPKLRVGDAVKLIGEEFGNYDFLQLAMALYPESNPEDWGL
jgi:hypothetical protein